MNLGPHLGLNLVPESENLGLLQLQIIKMKPIESLSQIPEGPMLPDFDFAISSLT